MTKVYVSATFRDLEECRSAVQLALRRLRVEDVAMESYVAEDRRPVERCLEDVRRMRPLRRHLRLALRFRAARLRPVDHRTGIPRGVEQRQALPDLPARRGGALAAQLRRPGHRGRADRGAAGRARRPAHVQHVHRTGRPGRAGHRRGRQPAGGDRLARARPERTRSGHPQALLRPAPPALRRPRPGRADADAERGIPADRVGLGLHRAVRPGGSATGRAAPRVVAADAGRGAPRSEDVPDEVEPGELVHLHESYRAKPLQRLFDVLGSPRPAGDRAARRPGLGQVDRGPLPRPRPGRRTPPTTGSRR